MLESTVASLLAVYVLCIATTAAHATPLETRTTTSSARSDVIVQLFQYNWASVANECTNWVGPAGYGYVQVSPPQEHIQGPTWWTDYQPVSYKLQSKRGARDQFISAVEACKSSGVGVLVDSVINLTAGSGTGVAGDAYTHYSYPTVPYNVNDFHVPCATDFSNATSVFNCQLYGLADLRTESTIVQETLANYLNDLLCVGVAGFRIDAAKSIQPSDLSSIYGLVTGPALIIQEVPWGPNQPVGPELYTSLGSVLEFRVAGDLYDKFSGGNLGGLLTWPGAGWTPSSKAVVFVANQDTERNPRNLNYLSSNNAYLLAHIFLLAQPYGTPTVYSGYNYTNNDAGAVSDASGNVLAVACGANGWRCEQRWSQIVNMIQFHAAVAGTSWNNQVGGSGGQIAFGRGAVGMLVMNYGATVWTTTLTTGVPDGNYCDIIHSTSPLPPTCAGPAIVVHGGRFTISVQPYDAVAFFVSGPSTPAPPLPPISGGVNVTFTEVASTTAGQFVVLTGAVPALGSWSPLSTSSPRLVNNNGRWSTTVNLPASTNIAYKFVVVDARGIVRWESDPNRQLQTTSSGTTMSVNSSWR